MAKIGAKERARCSAEGCERDTRARGMCHMHYRRARKNGTAGPTKFPPVTSDAEREERRLRVKRESYRRYQDRYSEKRKNQTAAYRERNRGLIRAKGREYCASRKEQKAAYDKEYRAKNNERVRLHWQNRRHREKSGQLSPGIVNALMLEQVFMCGVCSIPLLVSGWHIDHIVPLARGGTNTDENVWLLCPPCNLKKGARDPAEFLRSEGFLL